MRVYCINLDNRKERWDQTQEEMKVLGATPIRFSATLKRRRHSGCISSHMALWSKVKDEGIVMVIEDDILFLDNAKENFEMALHQLPEDWDMLYLGATLTKKIYRYSDNLYVLQGGSAAHGIIYNNQNGVIDYILKSHNRNRIDSFLRDDVQENFNCYMTRPMIAIQSPGFSNLIYKRTSGRAMRRAYKKYT